MNPNFDTIDAQLKARADKDTEIVTSINKVKEDYLPKTGGNVTQGLTIKNKTVAVSVNGATADANGNITIDVGGDVQSVNGVQPDEHGNVELDLGGDVQSVDGVEPDENGNVALDASTRDEILEATRKVTDVEVDVDVATHEKLQTAVARVEANLDGTVRSVNGNTPDKNGNIKPSQTGCLPLDGGTLTGTIEFNRPAGHIHKKDANGRMIIRGGTSNGDDGANLYLHGANYTEDVSYSGAFNLQARFGNVSCGLKGKPNGELTWGDKPVICVESWKSGASWYRKYSDGWIEQGGNIEAPNSGWTPIPLHIPFANKNYNLMTCNSGGTTDAFATKVETSGKNTTTTAYACVYHNSGTGIRWEAKGY